MSEIAGGEAVVNLAYARSLLDYLRLIDVEPANLYSKSRLVEIETTDTLETMPLGEWADMFKRAVAFTGDEDLPLKVGEQIQIRHLGILGYVIMSCSTLGDVVDQIGRYLLLVGEISSSRLIFLKGDCAELYCLWPKYIDDPPSAFEQSSAAARVHLARWLTGCNTFRFDAYFRFAAPADPGRYKRVFGGSIYFGQPETKIVFPASYLSAPVTMANRQAHQLFEAQAEAQLRARGVESEFLRQLKKVLSQKILRGHVSLDDVAKTLHLSTRTLHRRLHSHGQTFRCILDDVRRTHAENYLRGRGTSLAEVAFMLGYTEQSTFQKAFKRWTGMTPVEFREKFGSIA